MKATKKLCLHSVLLSAMFSFLLFPSRIAAQTYTTEQGYQIEVNLIPDKTTIMLGEPIYLSFCIRNRSNIDLGLVEGGDYRNTLGRPESFSVIVARQDGKQVPQPKTGPNMGGIVGSRKIPANGEYAIKLLLPHWATFEEIGNYTITCKRVLNIHEYQAKRFDPTNKSEEIAVQVSTQIKVIPVDDRKMGDVIESLGNTMLSANEDKALPAARALSYIADERAIKHFAQAIESSQQSIVFEAVRALSKFNNDSAITALKKRMDDQDKEIRHAIAVAFASSKHPQAVEQLLMMRKDKFYGVRLTALHALGKMTSVESLFMIQEMTQDEEKMVRNEAQRYLRERTSKQ